jgi:DNA-binding transcriptional ArsR family regulator
MLRDRMNRSDVAILAALLDGPLTVTSVAKAVGRSSSLVSERTTKLEAMRLVERRRGGNAVRVGFAKGRAAADLRLMMAEGPHIGLAEVLPGPGLLILPLLLPPGSTLMELRLGAGLSAPTVRGRIRLWRGMGLLQVGGSPHRYSIRPQLGHLIGFIESYAAERNQRFLESRTPAGTIVWQRRDSFLFSSRTEVPAPEFIPAGVSRLEELGYDVVSPRHCYLHRPGITQVAEAEALVQAVLMDPDDPRIARMVRRALAEHRVRGDELRGYAMSYGLLEPLKAMMPVGEVTVDGH